MIARVAVAVCLALCVWSPEAARAQVRDGAPMAAPGTGAIIGAIVTDDAAPRPIRHAIVTLNSLDRVIGRTAISDDAGQFAFASLPEGRYSLTAQKLGWVSGSYGAKAVGRPGRTLPLASGERATATIRMAHGAVISGTILDQFGQPVAGATVRALKNGYSLQTGERRLNPAGVSNSGPDERGAYRIYGLAPGDYYISVTNAKPSPTHGRDLHLTSDVDVQDALKTSPPNSAPAADVPQPTVGFAQVFYPGTTSVPQAAPIMVKAGEERTGVDFTVTYTSTTRVVGTVTSPLGMPIAAVLFLEDPTPTVPVTADTIVQATAGPDGRFTFSDVTPGAYVMSAHAALPPASDGERSQLVGTKSDLDVPPDGLTGLTVALQDALTVSGMLKYEGASPGPDLASLRVLLMTDERFMKRETGGPTTEADGRFTVSGVLPARYRVAVNLPSPPTRWRVSSATIFGHDALDMGADVRQSVTDAVITITDQISTLTGKLESAGVATDYTLILFAADSVQWRPLTRRLLTSRVAGDGTFSFTNVPPGDYWLAAVDDVEPGEWFDPSFLQRTEPTAIKVTIGEGEKKTQDLRIGGG